MRLDVNVFDDDTSLNAKETYYCGDYVMTIYNKPSWLKAVKKTNKAIDFRSSATVEERIALYQEIILNVAILEYSREFNTTIMVNQATIETPAVILNHMLGDKIVAFPFPEPTISS